MTRATGPENMALDVELLEAAEAGHSGWRVYGWDGLWVSLGRFQSPERALQTLATPHVMRPTGGRAVIHGHDVTVSAARPLNTLPSGAQTVRSVFPHLVAPIVDGLMAAGVECRTGVSGASGPGEDCFAHVAPCDIVGPRGEKVCGCALRLTATAVLLQASIPVGEPLAAPDSVLQGTTAMHRPLEFEPERLADLLALHLERSILRLVN